MSYDEAREFIDFNIEGAYIGEDTPILVNLLTPIWRCMIQETT